MMMERSEPREVEERRTWRAPIRDAIDWIIAAIVVLLILSEAALGLRLGFKIAEANAGNNFVDFIYDLTAWMIKPFSGVFEDRSVNGGVFEPGTVIAMVMYFIGAVLLIALLRMIDAYMRPAGGRRVMVGR
jgi:hypothetical protein